MADKTITELESIPNSSLSLDDELPIYEKTNGSTLKTTIGDLKVLCLEDAVMKAGDTMTGHLKLQSSNIDENTTPSANQWGNSHYQLLSKNGTRSAYWELGHLTDGKLGSEIGALRNVNGSNVYNTITQWITPSGERIVEVSDSAAWRSALGVKWNTFIKMVDYTKSGVSTAAGTTRDYTFSVAQPGYTPVGIVGYRIASGDGTCVVSCYLSGTTVTMRVRNNGTSANTPDGVSVTVLYCINAQGGT